MSTKRILFIGAGRMAQSMIAGMVQHKEYVHWEILVSNRAHSDRLSTLTERFGVTPCVDWAHAAGQADVIVLAIPPGEHPSVLATLRSIVRTQLVVTVAAGIDVSTLERALPEGTPVAWMMPNTAAKLGRSMTLFACGKAMTALHRDMLVFILDSIGNHQECTEQQIHDLTAISGSAPAFLYRMAQEMNQLAMEFGLEEMAAREVVAQMFYGSACMLASLEDPAILEDEVTSPGGSTAAGIHVLEEASIGSLIRAAVLETNRRANELTEGIQQQMP